MSQADSFDLIDALVTRDVESDVADAIALRGVGHQGSSFEREMAAQPFVGELTRDCERCDGFGVVRLSDEKQAAWKKELARLRMKVVNARAEDSKTADRLEPLEDALEDSLTQYRNACRCPECGGFGRTTPPGVTRQRIECDQCGGRGRDFGKRVCPKCAGDGFASLGVPDSCWTTVRCWRCRGLGNVLDDEGAPVCVCPVCRGDSYTIPVTVRETGCSKKGRLPFGYTPADDADIGSAAGMVSVPTDFVVVDQEALEQLGKARDVIEQARQLDAPAIAALEAFLGAEARHYEQDTPWGRGHVVWPHTVGGKALLEIATKAQGRPSRPLVALAAMRAAEDHGLNRIEWQRHMKSAVQESDALIKRARAAIKGVIEGTAA